MRRMLLMIRMLTVLCAVCLTVLLNWQSKDDALAGTPLLPTESTVMIPQQQHHHEAMLTDASQIYRICSSRPQRILPSQGSNLAISNTIPSLSLVSMKARMRKQSHN